MSVTVVSSRQIGEGQHTEGLEQVSIKTIGWFEHT